MTTSASHPVGGTGAPGGAGRSGGSPTSETAKDQARQTAGTAADQARSVAGTAAEQAKSVAGTAKQEAAHVAGEAKQQVSGLVGQLGGQVNEQSRTQRDRLVSLLREVGDELEHMAEAGGRGGLATDLVRQAASRTRSVGSHLDGHEPAELLDQLRSTARRRPGAFLVGAAAAGLLVGRLTKAAREAHKPDADAVGYGSPQRYPATAGYQTPGYETSGYETSGYETTRGAYGTTPGAGTTAPITPVTGGYAPGGDVLPPTTGGVR